MSTRPRNYHSALSSPPTGGILIDGTQVFRFTSVIADFPADKTDCGPRWTSHGGNVQVVNVTGLAPGRHTITTTSTSIVEAPWSSPFVANIDCCDLAASTITFDERMLNGLGFNGQYNHFLISADGKYRAEFFWLSTSGHSHLSSGSPFGGIYEGNHNNSGHGGGGILKAYGSRELTRSRSRSRRWIFGARPASVN